MVFYQSFATEEPANVICLCGTLLLNYALASVLAYILCNAAWSTACVNHHFVAKKTNTLKFCHLTNHPKQSLVTSPQAGDLHVSIIMYTLFSRFQNRAFVQLVIAIKHCGPYFCNHTGRYTWLFLGTKKKKHFFHRKKQVIEKLVLPSAFW